MSRGEAMPWEDRVDGRPLAKALRPKQEEVHSLRRQVLELCGPLGRAEHLVSELLRSDRWRIGSRLGELPYLLLGRRPSPRGEPLARVDLPGVTIGGGTSRLDDLFSQSQSSTFQETPREQPHEWLARFLERAIRERHRYSSPVDSKPLISIVVPTRSRGPVRRQAVSSVLSQTYENWELLFCDDGGRDDAQAYLRSLDDSRISYSRIERARDLPSLTSLHRPSSKIRALLTASQLAQHVLSKRPTAQ